MGQKRSTAIGNAVLVVSFDGNSTTQTVNVVTQPAAQLAHRYSFDIDGTDSVGTAHGTAVDGAAFMGDGTVALVASTKGHVLLPPGLITNRNAFTIESWATFYGLANWCRLFDFGDQNAVSGLGRFYVMMCPVAVLRDRGAAGTGAGLEVGSGRVAVARSRARTTARGLALGGRLARIPVLSRSV